MTSREKFQKLVWNYYKKQGRHDLPWRKTHDPYKILVSEVMLQQTQVERVIPFYKAFLKKFPTIKALAAAPLAEILKSWQGLGYNRRAKMLHMAAREVVGTYKGKFPRSVTELQELPGVGPYTARAVATFAYGQNAVFIETNIRTAVTDYFFKKNDVVDDKEILKILSKIASKEIGDESPREWNWALMDYGASLKRSGVRINAKSKTYVPQSKFTGSNREARGAILRELAKGSQVRARLVRLMGDDRTKQMELQLSKLSSEGLIEIRGTKYELPRR